MAVLAGAALGMTGPQTPHGKLTVTVERSAWLQAFEWARDELGCSDFEFLCGVDELDADPAGISVVAHLLCPQGRHHLLLRTRVPADDFCLPTATGLYRAADRHELATHERFGLVFTGHPALDPLLLLQWLSENHLEPDSSPCVTGLMSGRPCREMSPRFRNYRHGLAEPFAR